MDLEANAGIDNIRFEHLIQAIVNMDEMKASFLTQKLISQGFAPMDILENGLTAGMFQAGELFEQEEYFIPEMLLCAEAMEAGFSVLRPYFNGEKIHSKGRILIGVIEGDTHDIGKNIVSLVLKGAGFDVLDLGRDVPPRKFIDSALSFDADIIAISALMTTTMENIRGVISLLEEEGLRERFFVICGGKPLSRGFAKRIGADGYTSNANAAMRLALRMMKNTLDKTTNKY